MENSPALKNLFGLMNQFQGRLIRAKSHLQRWAFPLLLIFALFYYGSYYNAGLTLNGEAGSNVLLAMRIQQGWVPLKDMFLGYNLMWFYPLTWIFHFTGPHLLATQIYFMLLSAVAAFLGYWLVRRATGWAWLALLTGVLMVMMPGAIFRNYMGFIGTLASFVLVKAYVLDAGSSWWQCFWMGAAGAAISLCFLIRIEPSLLIAVVWIGLIFIYPVLNLVDFRKRFRTTLAGTLMGFALFAAIHTPFIIHAERNGFREQFLGQYNNFIHLMLNELNHEVRPPNSTSTLPSESGNLIYAGLPPLKPVISSIVPSSSSQATGAIEREGRRGRPALMDALFGKTALYFTLSIYFPILSAGLLTLFGGLLLLLAMYRGSVKNKCYALLILTTTGCALSLFPQYYFFRPDSVHLAEFMVPFYPALACGVFVAVCVYKEFSFLRGPAVLVVVVCALQVIVAFNSLYGRDGSGSIKQARGRTAYFHALNGVDFRVPPKELPQWEGLRDAILQNSKLGEFVVTYPYVAVLNVLSDRPSYQFKLYADNATELSDFSEKAIEDLSKNKPAVVVINNRDINKTEVSRFKNWAAPFYQYIKKNYTLEGIYFDQVEVFVRPAETKAL
jgi:hypothetical protein